MYLCISTGASNLPPDTGRKAGEGTRSDSSEGEKPEKPPRSQYRGAGERESERGEGGKDRGRRKKRRSERGSLHEELLEFISQEWASLEIAEV